MHDNRLTNVSERVHGLLQCERCQLWFKGTTGLHVHLRRSHGISSFVSADGEFCSVGASDRSRGRSGVRSSRLERDLCSSEAVVNDADADDDADDDDDDDDHWWSVVPETPPLPASLDGLPCSPCLSDTDVEDDVEDDDMEEVPGSSLPPSSSSFSSNSISDNPFLDQLLWLLNEQPDRWTHSRRIITARQLHPRVVEPFAELVDHLCELFQRADDNPVGRASLLRLLLELPLRVLQVDSITHSRNILSAPRRIIDQQLQAIATLRHATGALPLCPLLWEEFRDHQGNRQRHAHPPSHTSSGPSSTSTTSDSNTNSSSSSSSSSLRPLHGSLVHQLVADKQLSRAALRVQSPFNSAPPSEQTLQQLRELHPLPGPSSGNHAWPCLPSPVNLDRLWPPGSEETHLALVSASIRRLPRRSAPGPSGWTFDHFKAVNTHSSHFAPLLLSLIPLAQQGCLPWRGLLTSSTLIALSKPQGGIRPIAIGDAWLRLITRILMRLDPCLAAGHNPSIANESVLNYVSEYQYGVNTPCGVEMVVHQLRELVACNPQALAVLDLDYRNAFNLVERPAIAAALVEFAPHWLPFFSWSYQMPSDLLCQIGNNNNSVLSSARGVRQGDPLGPLFFSMAFRRLLDQVASDLPSFHQFAYMDDHKLVLMAPPSSSSSSTVQSISSSVQHLLALINRVGSPLGLQLNLPKSSLWLPRCSSDLDALALQVRSHFPDLSVVTSGVSILGVPMGSAGYVQSVMSIKLDKLIQRCLDRMTDCAQLPLQSRLLILRQCLSTIPNFWARTLHIQPSSSSSLSSSSSSNLEMPQSIADIFSTWDEHVLNAVAGWSHTSSSDLPWQLVHLPLKRGGLGLRLARLQHLHAFAASVLSCASLYSHRTGGVLLRLHPSSVQRVWPSFVTLHRALTGQDPLLMQPPTANCCFLPALDPSLTLQDASQRSRPRLQKLLQQPADDGVAASLPLSPTTAALAIDSGNSLWLTTLPVSSAHSIPDQEFRMLLRLRLRQSPLPVLFSPSTSSCPLCLLPPPLPSNHAYCCRQVSAFITLRHDRLVSLLASHLPNAQVERTLASLAPSMTPPVSLARLDLLVPTPSPTAVDVTIVACRHQDSSWTHTHSRASRRKSSKYLPLLRQANLSLDFAPFIVSPFGQLSPPALKCLRDWFPSPSVRSDISTRIAISVARGTARAACSWLRRTSSLTLASSIGEF